MALDVVLADQCDSALCPAGCSHLGRPDGAAPSVGRVALAYHGTSMDRHCLRSPATEPS